MREWKRWASFSQQQSKFSCRIPCTALLVSQACFISLHMQRNSVYISHISVWLHWQTFPDAATLSCRIKRPKQKATGGKLSVPFHGVLHAHLFEPHPCVLNDCYSGPGQVGYVTSICFTCFLIRCILVSAPQWGDSSPQWLYMPE